MWLLDGYYYGLSGSGTVGGAVGRELEGTFP